LGARGPFAGHAQRHAPHGFPGREGAATLATRGAAACGVDDTPLGLARLIVVEAHTAENGGDHGYVPRQDSLPWRLATYLERTPEELGFSVRGASYPSTDTGNDEMQRRTFLGLINVASATLGWAALADDLNGFDYPRFESTVAGRTGVDEVALSDCAALNRGL
jgi:hypothetical protein